MGCWTRIQGQHLKVGTGPGLTPADVAMLVWLQNPDILKRQHAQGYALRQKRFVYFCSQFGGGPVPDCDPAIVQAQQQHLDDWFDRRKRGRDSQVFTFESNARLWIIVRHGQPYKREGTMGNTASVYFRPEKYDVLVYDNETGTIGIHADGKRLIEFYLYSFGMHLFGNERHFASEQKVTLQPLLRLGAKWLHCDTAEGIE